MRLCYQLLLLTLAVLSATACDDSRHRYGKTEIKISGAYEKALDGQAEFGYAASIAGGAYSFGLAWPEDSVEQLGMPMSAANTSPLFAWYSQKQPPKGVHRVSQSGDNRAGAISALLLGPHEATMWSSDSGTIHIVKSNDSFLALDVAGTSTSGCPATKGAPVRTSRVRFGYTVRWGHRDRFRLLRRGQRAN